MGGGGSKFMHRFAGGTSAVDCGCPWPSKRAKNSMLKNVHSCWLDWSLHWHLATMFYPGIHGYKSAPKF